MPEYIEREALCKHYQDRFEFLKNSSYIAVNGGYKVDDEMQAASVIAKEFLDKLEKAPAADVEPVKHGYIVIKPRVIGGFVNHKCPNPQCKHEWQTDERVKTLEVLCSECGKVLAHNYQSYCQYCGAKMDGKEVQE